MGKITPFGRLVIISLILGGIYAGLKYTGVLDQFTKSKNNHEQVENTDNHDIVVEEEKSIDSNAQEEIVDIATSVAFSYNPPAPVNGKLKGVVELGASGFNSFIINMDNAKNWELKKAEYGNSLVFENMATELDIREGLKKYIASMLDFGVAGKDIHFVVSSGAQRAENIQKIIDALKTLKYYVNPVSAEQEGQLALKCVLPIAYEQTAFVVDIGSGNTKISWKEGQKTSSLSSHGSKYFQEGVTDKAVYEDVMAQASQIPDVQRKTCFIIGGVPFKLAKQVRKDKERFTTLLMPEAYKPEDAKDKAGLNIYKGIADATNCKTFIFDWDSNFTIGFLLDLP
jgi:hypothetical protein